MIYPSIRIEGAILSPDILSQVEELPGQRPADFGLESGTKVKDEIARAWADAQDYWRIFQRKLETVKEGSNATTETRNLWMVPMLGLLRYDLEYQPKGTELNGQVYTISHGATNRDGMSVQIVGYNDPAGLDRKPANATRCMSAHALVQEFLNLHEQLYGFVTDGHVLRLLRDSSRLVKQSYLEFDLDRIFSDGLFADFAVLYRLLHSSRMPATNESAAESLIEQYHQDSLDSGARIREGLSQAVEKAILDFGNGFLEQEDNVVLREAITRGEISPGVYYQQLLRLIYRLLFLMVIEERDLIFPPETSKKQRDIHRHYYSIARLRRLSERRYLADPRRHDLWLALQASFQLFEADGPGERLGIAPLAGDLFSPLAIQSLSGRTLGNDVLLGCLRALGLYRHPDSGQLIRVNYGALNVEEFGSVYEGLLEYEPVFTGEGPDLRFGFGQGDMRAATGSHYTPDELVQPLIQHSLDHLIAERLKDEDPEAALLELRVADIACGSGHILLAAARRIATELAVVRTEEEQPSPPAYRAALRDTICHCIYGVDLNPLAVELCKVALWLEAHIPGQPLNFLDHHIKCGNAIVGFARREELAVGVPTEAFKSLPGDDKDVASAYRKKNRDDLKHQKQVNLELTPQMHGHFDAVHKEWHSLTGLPEQTPAQVEAKRKRFATLVQGEHLEQLRSVADIPVAQFYIPKVSSKEAMFVTDAEFRRYWRGEQKPQGQGVRVAKALGEKKRFFHWYLEFPEVMERGGFDCILGNPPYLGGTHLSGTYGYAFCECMKWRYAPTGLSDLVVYFLRRIYCLLRESGITSIITTNSIVDGDIRKDGLEQVVSTGAEIIMAVRGLKWPGPANLVVSLLAVHKGKWAGPKALDNQRVMQINSFFENGEEFGAPAQLAEQSNMMYEGYKPLDGGGFSITAEEASHLIAHNHENREVIFKIINGYEINNEPEQRATQDIIFFFDKSREDASAYEAVFTLVEERVKPFRAGQKRASNRDYWWVFGEKRPGLTRKLRDLSRCFAVARTTKHLCFSAVEREILLSEALKAFTTDRWDLFTVVQSTLHEVWARKYSGSLKQDLRYSPSKCFDTFPFPEGLWQTVNPALAELGERYHQHRKALMKSLWLGLTKIYNLFHDAQLTPEKVAKVSKKDAETAAVGYESLLELRRLHVALDLAVRDAYGWQDLGLDHDFHEVETLAENDRIRYTISPAARREVLKRLLAENHARAEKEQSNQASNKQPKARGSLNEKGDTTPNLF